MVACGKCGREAIFESVIEGRPIPYGVTEDGFELNRLSESVTYWKHPDGRFCSA
jgi:hypothetical protein